MKQKQQDMSLLAETVGRPFFWESKWTKQ